MNLEFGTWLDYKFVMTQLRVNFLQYLAVKFDKETKWMKQEIQKIGFSSGQLKQSTYCIREKTSILMLNKLKQNLNSLF